MPMRMTRPLYASLLGLTILSGCGGGAESGDGDPLVSWTVRATAGTGGSMLIIGSAAGVAAMGMENIDFIWYLKKVAWLALIGFLAGAFTFILLQPIIHG